MPTAGTWSAWTGGARFAPAFPAVPGATYVLLARSPAGGVWVVRGRAVVPETTPAPTTRVVALDPDVAVVPENLLRFSIGFSAAMEEGGAGAHVHLRSADGRAVPGALLPMPPELWDSPRRRLTVLLDPGRLKRGLRPHAEAGPPLRRGTAVTLVVDEQVRDAAGAPLLAGAARGYDVGAPVRSRVDPLRWDVRWPTTGGDALTVGFGRPLDRALVDRCLRVVDAAGRPVPGRAAPAPGAAGWTFSPAGAPAPDWALLVHPDLEDLAGNSVRRVFDRDLREAGDEPLATSGVVLRPDGSAVVRPARP